MYSTHDNEWLCKACGEVLSVGFGCEDCLDEEDTIISDRTRELAAESFYAEYTIRPSSCPELPDGTHAIKSSSEWGAW